MFSVELTFKVAGRAVSLDEFAQAVLAKSFEGLRQDVLHLRQAQELGTQRPATERPSEPRVAEPRAVGIDRAAKLLGLSSATIRKYIRERKLHSIRFGRRVLIPMETVEQLLREGLPSLRRTGSAK